MKINLYGVIGAICFFCLVGLGIVHDWTSQWLIAGAGIVFYAAALIIVSWAESQQADERDRYIKIGRPHFDDAANAEYARLRYVLALAGLISGLILFTLGNIPLRTTLIDNLAVLFVSVIAGLTVPRLVFVPLLIEEDYRKTRLYLDDNVDVTGGIELALVTALTVLFLHNGSLIYMSVAITIFVFSTFLFVLYEERTFDRSRILIGLEIALILAAAGMFVNIESIPLPSEMATATSQFIGYSLKIVISFAIGLAIPFLLIRKSS